MLHVTDRAAVLCKALQHKTDMVGVQLHKPAAYHLGRLVVPGNVQQLTVGSAGVHQQIYDLIDGILIVRAKPEQEVYLQRLRKVLFQLFALAHLLCFFRIERISLTHFSVILISLICLWFWLFQNCDFGSTRTAVLAILYLRFWQSRRKILDVDQAGPAQTLSLIHIFVIGKDTRRSSYMFEYSLVAGLTASGADAYLLHVTTTPSVAYIARVDDFDCGIMISASHNPYYDNGIKLIDCYGEKMPEETLLLVEDYIDGKLHVFDKDWPELPFAHREHIGCTVDYVAGRNRYMGYLISLGIYSFRGVKVGLDCANGASWNIAKSVFDALGADTYVINNKPNGLNIDVYKRQG